jgi:hypothetical protein
LKKTISDKNKKKEIINNDKIVNKFHTLLSAMTEKDVEADDVVMLSKKEFKELLDILKLLLAFYIKMQ